MSEQKVLLIGGPFSGDTYTINTKDPQFTIRMHKLPDHIANFYDGQQPFNEVMPIYEYVREKLRGQYQEFIVYRYYDTPVDDMIGELLQLAMK